MNEFLINQAKGISRYALFARHKMALTPTLTPTTTTIK
jgi:hypothetical protein